MSVTRITFDGEIDMVQRAIDRLKAFEPKDGYYLAYSGGKDSIVIKRLAEMAKVKFEAHYHCTSVDPPELVRFIKKQYLLAFNKMLKNYDIPPKRWKSAQDVYDWWVGEAQQKQIEGQRMMNF